MKFLQENGIHNEALDCNALLERLRASMKAGLAGQGPLPMLPSSIQIPEAIPRTGEFPAFDVGGTNTRSARIQFFPDRAPEIHHLKRGKMPGAKEYVTPSAFYESLCEVLLPNLHSNEKLGYCFSYAFDQQHRLLHWSKGIQAPEIVGTDVVQGLKDALAARGVEKVDIAMLNDTVATLLAAYAAAGQTSYAGYVGFILGTGVNVAYAERASAIPKAPTLPQEQRFPINCETGNFTDFERSKFDERYETFSGNGKALWERCISGVHLGPLCTEVLRTAAEANLLSEKMASYVRTANFTFIELDHFAAGQTPELFQTTLEEQACIRRWITAIVERAAIFASVNIAAAALASAEAQGATEGTILINADGSTFWKTVCIPFAARIQALTQGLVRPAGFEIRTLQIEDAPLIGAALAAI